MRSAGIGMLMLLSAAAAAAPADDTVCVLDAGDAQGALARLQGLAPERVSVVALDADLAGTCGVVVLGSDWAEQDWSAVHARFDTLGEFVRQGGALLVFQPNPYGREFPDARVTVDLLGAPFTVENFYRSETAKPVAEHPLVDGIPANELPHPTDRITDHAPAWTALVRGEKSGDASLLAGEFECGRAAVDTGNPTVRAGSHSDRFLAGLLVWLGERKRAGCRPDV